MWGFCDIRPYPGIDPHGDQGEHSLAWSVRISGIRLPAVESPVLAVGSIFVRATRILCALSLAGDLRWERTKRSAAYHALSHASRLQSWAAPGPSGAKKAGTTPACTFSHDHCTGRTESSPHKLSEIAILHASTGCLGLVLFSGSEAAFRRSGGGGSKGGNPLLSGRIEGCLGLGERRRSKPSTACYRGLEIPVAAAPPSGGSICRWSGLRLKSRKGLKHIRDLTHR